MNNMECAYYPNQPTSYVGQRTQYDLDMQSMFTPQATMCNTTNSKNVIYSNSIPQPYVSMRTQYDSEMKNMSKQTDTTCNTLNSKNV